MKSCRNIVQTEPRLTKSLLWRRTAVPCALLLCGKSRLWLKIQDFTTLVCVHLVQKSFWDLWNTRWSTVAGSMKLLRLEFWVWLDLVLLVSSLKVTREGTHYKFLPLWTLWHVMEVASFVSVDILWIQWSHLSQVYWNEVKAFCLFALMFRNVQISSFYALLALCAWNKRI